MPAIAVIGGLMGLLILAIVGSMSQSAADSVSVGDGGPMFTVNVQPATGGPSGHLSDQSLTGVPITDNIDTWPGPTSDFPNASVWNICTAVALAEGFNGGPSYAPYDLNNPGDLSPGDEAGEATSGPAQQHGGSAVIAFATCEGGFRALYTKFENIVLGRSTVYPVSFTWEQVAAKYAADSSAWLANVTHYLGVDPQSRPTDYQA